MTFASNIFSNSSLTSKATLGCIFQIFCLTGLVVGSTNNWCATHLGSSLGMSWYDHAKKPMFSWSTSIRRSSYSCGKEAVMYVIQGVSIRLMLTSCFFVIRIDDTSNPWSYGGRMKSPSSGALERFSPSDTSFISCLFFDWSDGTPENFLLGDTFIFLFWCGFLFFSCGYFLLCGVLYPISLRSASLGGKSSIWSMLGWSQSMSSGWVRGSSMRWMDSSWIIESPKGMSSLWIFSLVLFSTSSWMSLTSIIFPWMFKKAWSSFLMPLVMGSPYLVLFSFLLCMLLHDV